MESHSQKSVFPELLCCYVTSVTLLQNIEVIIVIDIYIIPTYIDMIFLSVNYTLPVLDLDSACIPFRGA
jgi:hypothetical protein